MKKFRFRDQGLAGDIFYPETGQASSAGLFLFGLPSFPGRNKVTQSLVSSGMLAFQPHYLGTYDSDGEFSPASIIETCSLSQEITERGIVQKIKDGERFALPKLEVAVGHSFGALAVMRSAPVLRNLRLLVLMAGTAHYSQSNPNFGNKASEMKQLDYIRRANPYTYRLAPNEMWRDVMIGQDPLPKNERHPFLEKVVVILGGQDDWVDIAAVQSSFHMLVEAYCGPGIPFAIHIIPQGGHGMEDLVEAGAHFSLSKLLREHGFASRSD